MSNLQRALGSFAIAEEHLNFLIDEVEDLLEALSPVALKEIDHDTFEEDSPGDLARQILVSVRALGGNLQAGIESTRLVSEKLEELF
jgi:hypothetical protein